MTSDDGVWGDRHEFDDMEDWVDARHRTREFELRGVDADWLHDWERAKVSMHKLFCGSRSADVRCIKVHLFACYEGGCWGSLLVVVPGHVIL